MKVPSTHISTSLDISPEKKDLQTAIAAKEKHYNQLISTLEGLKSDVANFQQTYDERIRSLYARLNELESMLFKYSHINEYVDDIFSFSEAEKIFDETMNDRRARMENEARKQRQAENAKHKKKHMSVNRRLELRKLYRKLAHLFHPDKNGGDEQMMKRINKAYSDGNLDELRDLELEITPETEDQTLKGLENRLHTLIRSIDKAKREILSLQQSDMYILRNNLLKLDRRTNESRLENLAKELRKEILNKEKELHQFAEKFGVDEKSSI